MAINELILWVAMIGDAVICGLIVHNVIIGKRTWEHKLVRLGVVLAWFGLAMEIPYSFNVLMAGDVPDAAPLWVFKDVGLWILFGLDMYKPSLYWIDLKEGDK